MGKKTAGLSIQFRDFTNKTGDLSKPNKELINAGGENDANKHGETWVDYQLDSTFSELCLTPINLING